MSISTLGLDSSLSQILSPLRLLNGYRVDTQKTGAWRKRDKIDIAFHIPPSTSLDFRRPHFHSSPRPVPPLHSKWIGTYNSILGEASSGIPLHCRQSTHEGSSGVVLCTPWLHHLVPNPMNTFLCLVQTKIFAGGWYSGSSFTEMQSASG